MSYIIIGYIKIIGYMINYRLYRLHYVLKHKICTIFRANTQTC